MYISFNQESMRFTLNTINTTYVFDIVKNRFPVHRYYGKKTETPQCYKAAYHSFSPYLQDVGTQFSLADDFVEMPFFGSGDFRCSALKIKGINGDSCTSFFYDGYEIFSGRREIKGIPFARANEDCETLALRLKDPVNNSTLTLFYTVFYNSDIISRYFMLENNGSGDIKLEKAMCLSLDLPGHNYDLISLYGKHMDERRVQRVPLFYGNQRIMSRRGASSHQFNPFIVLAAHDADENAGDVYAFNLVYSGNFLDEVEVDHAGNTRVCVGPGDENFGYLLKSGESFASPEAVMIYSEKGLGQMSRQMHKFVRENILPEDKFEQRPVVLNTWEACHFDIDGKLILDFADEAQKYGMDMVVVDDGWFGNRFDDNRALGDWDVNRQKFPDGLKSFAERVKAKGVKFGIWVEPEMISPDSDLYRAHPDWCLCCKGRQGSLSRSQLVLDFCNPDVIKYLKDKFAAVFDGVPIDYFKWDFNRHLSEVGSNYLPKERQDEAPFRFMLGVYELFNFFAEHFPDAMIENCSGGGGRYDLAMMALSTQIWTSDNTSATARVRIQHGSSLGYPAYVMSCHVSNPGDSAEEHKILDYKYKVALGGMLGYELNILKKSTAVKEKIREQIEFYRYVEQTIKYGDLYRLISPFENQNEISAYYYKAQEGKQILLSFLQNKTAAYPEKYLLKIEAAEEKAEYKEYFSGKVYKGSRLKKGIELQSYSNGGNGDILLFERI